VNTFTDKSKDFVTKTRPTRKAKAEAPAVGADVALLKRFDFEGHRVRIQDRDGNPWVVLADLCKVIEHSNPTVAAQILDDDERAKVSLGRQGETIVINEAGLYRLLLRSDKPEAKRFQKWVVGTVLPSIRKTGGYGVPTGELSPEVRKVLGGIIKAVVQKDTDEFRAEFDAKMAELRATVDGVLQGVDPAQSVVIDYHPMLAILINEGVGPKKRRALSQSCSARMRRWCIANDQTAAVRHSRESARYLFHRAAAAQWLAAEGRALIRAHQDRIAGQGRLELVPTPKAKQRPTTEPSHPVGA
jgi:prophage antirepressor-like protein